MSSFRDQRNPEVVHFPGTLASFATLGLCAIIALALLMAATTSGPLWLRLASGVPTLALLVIIYFVWPRRIVLGERGVWLYSLLGRKRFMIPWNELAEPAESVELAILSKSPRTGFASNQTVVLASNKLALRTVHTPRHSDRDRFLDLARKRFAKPPVVIQ